MSVETRMESALLNTVRGSELSVEDFTAALDCSKETARKAANNLTDEGLLQKVKRNRSFGFIVRSEKIGRWNNINRQRRIEKRRRRIARKARRVAVRVER